MNGVEARIERLEAEVARLRRRARRGRRAALLAGLLLAALVCMGQAGAGGRDARYGKLRAESVETRRVVLLDNLDKPRAFLGRTTASGYPTFTLGNARGGYAVRLHTHPLTGPGLELWDEDERLRVRLAVAGDKGPELGLHDAAGRLRVRLGLGEGGAPRLRLLDEEGKAVVDLPER
jgi:hypothetical protein